MTQFTDGTDERDAGGAGDELVLPPLRERYRAPSDPAYWEALERRIMARVRSEPLEWWHAFGDWAGAGLAAAGLAALLAGLAWREQARGAEARMAWESVIDTSPAATVAGAPRPATDREATIRYLISH